MYVEENLNGGIGESIAGGENVWFFGEKNAWFLENLKDVMEENWGGCCWGEESGKVGSENLYAGAGMRDWKASIVERRVETPD